MGISGYAVNMASAVIAVGYMDYSFPKKYNGVRRWAYFAAGCAVYFSVVTALNQMARFEGLLGFSYGLLLAAYGFAALEGRPAEFLLAGLLWVLTALAGTHGIFGIMGIITGESLDMMLGKGDDQLFFASLAALMVKYSLGRVISTFFRKQEGLHKRENWVAAGTFLAMALLGMGMFALEIGGFGQCQRYFLTIGILLDEAGIIAALVGLYHRIGKYQREELEEQCRREREEERLEGLRNLYQVCRETNHWRHDMQAVMGVLCRMLENGKYREAEEQLKKLCGDMGMYPELQQPTGNEGLDEALVKAVPKCRENGIGFRYSVLGSPSGVDCVALGTLVDNMLRNGMEACLGADGVRKLDLVVRNVGTGLEIWQENSTDGPVLRDNPRLESGKEERERHGFGMESIYRVVEEYCGTYDCWEEEGMFCQRVYLMYQSR